MKKEILDIYSDYLICSFSHVTATGLSKALDGQISHDKITRLLAGEELDSKQLWRFVSTYDYVAGDFMWTGIDYLGESRWPGKGSSAGVIDTCGFKKDGFYFYQSQWTAKPMLHLFPHWNWKGREGQFIPVTAVAKPQQS